MENFKAGQDIDGNESSKRKKGMMLIDVAVYMAVIYFLIGLLMSIILGEELKYKFPIEIWWTIIGLGASLLGITLAERFGVSKK